MCGKNFALLGSYLAPLGSPPHVREKPNQLPHTSPSSGITPACAGKTSNENCLLTYNQDHPRMCGKNGLASLKRKHD